MKELILGLDIGSSGVRGALFDARGRMLAKTLVRKERSLTATRAGGAEIDADKAFREIVGVIDQVFERTAGLKSEVTHVASCAFWHSLVGIDEKDKPTTGVYGWADNRSRKYVEVLRRRLDERVVHNRTGARFHSSYWPAKLLWLKKEFPEVWRRTTKWISFSDYAALKLCSSAATSISTASATGVFDIRRCEWDADVLRYLKVKRTAMAEVAAADGASSLLLPKWRKRWPRLREARWLPAVGDGAANSVGSDCVTRDKAALMVGTSGAMRIVYKGEPPDKLPPGLFCYRVDRERVVIGGALSDGGGLYAWIKRNLRIDMSDAAIGKELARRGADAHGLVFLPFFAGERSTGYNENAAGSIAGLTMAHDAINILQAAMESVAYRFADMFDHLNGVAWVGEIIASGEALRLSPVWAQIIADVLGRDLRLLREPEASLRGAVLLALESTGKIELSDKATSKFSVITHHPGCHSIYKLARDRHIRQYGKINI